MDGAGRDGHQPYSGGLYTYYKDSRHSRWDDHPQYKELIDPGTYISGTMAYHHGLYWL